MADIIKLDMTKLWASSGDKIQPSDAQMASGWLVQQVPRQTWNWFENRQDQNIAYLLQKGLPEWDSTTEYLANKSFMNRGGLPYKCIQTNTGQDPATATAYWERVSVQYSTSLEAVRLLTPAADRLAYYTSGTAAALTTFTAFARTLLDDADAATARTTLSAQTLNATLTALSSGGLVPAVNVLPYFDSTTTAAGTPLTSYARTLLDDANAAAARTTLEVLSATQSAADLEAVRATLDAAKQPLNTLLTSLSSQVTTANSMTYYTGSNVAAVTTLSVYARGFLAVADAAAARAYLGADNATNLTSGTIPLARIPTSLTGVNAATATALQTARTIQGVSFNGTANITLSVVDKDSGTGSATLPAGTTAQRTASPVNGQIRYNSDTNEFEGYQNGDWAGIGGGNPLFTVLWWPSRTAIPAGYVAADGQTLNRSSYQAAWTRIDAGDVPVVTEANWTSTSTLRGSYTPGNGTTTFRVPDLNGKSSGTLGSMFLRGDGTNSAGVAGQLQASDNLSHTHLFTSTAGAVRNTFPSLVGYSLNTGAAGYADVSTSAVIANSGGSESRPLSATGVWVVKLLGGATAASQEDASVAVAALDARVTPFSGRNRVINGACHVTQRIGATYTTGVNGYSGPDRFRAANGTTGGSFSQSASTIGDKPCVKQLVNTAPPSLATGNYWSGIEYRIEGRDFFDLLGNQIVVSFTFLTNVSGTFAVSIRDSGSTSFVTTFTAVANVPKVVSFTTTVPSGANVPATSALGVLLNIGALNTGTFQAGSANNWLTGTGNLITVAGVTNWGATAGNFISLTELQVEAGTVASPFERKPVAEEILACQRYYQTVLQSIQSYATLAQVPFIYSAPLSSPMRANPSTARITNGSNINVFSANMTATSTDMTSSLVSNNSGGFSSYGSIYALDAEL